MHPSTDGGVILWMDIKIECGSFFAIRDHVIFPIKAGKLTSNSLNSNARHYMLLSEFLLFAIKISIPSPFLFQTASAL